MELIRGLHNLRPDHRGSVLTIGAFDGVHRGHQEMIRVLRERAVHYGLPATVVSFEPTPREYFARGTPPARLTRFRERYDALVRYGVDRFVCLAFNERMRSMTGLSSSHGAFLILRAVATMRASRSSGASLTVSSS